MRLLIISRYFGVVVCSQIENVCLNVQVHVDYYFVLNSFFVTNITVQVDKFRDQNLNP